MYILYCLPQTYCCGGTVMHLTTSLFYDDNRMTRKVKLQCHMDTCLHLLDQYAYSFICSWVYINAECGFVREALRAHVCT